MQPFSFFSPLASLFSLPMLPCDIEPLELVEPCEALEPVDPCEAAGDELCVPCAPLVSLCGVDWATATATKNTIAVTIDSNILFILCSPDSFLIQNPERPHATACCASRTEMAGRRWQLFLFPRTLLIAARRSSRDPALSQTASTTLFTRLGTRELPENKITGSSGRLFLIEVAIASPS